VIAPTKPLVRAVFLTDPTSSVPSTMSPSPTGSTASMPERRESPTTASNWPPTRSRGPAATIRPPISKAWVSAVAKAAATKAGAASSAEDSIVQSPINSVSLLPRLGFVISIT
jgi:hypothetical protein